MTNNDRENLETLGVYIERLLAYGIVHPTEEQLDKVCFACSYIIGSTKNKSQKAIDKLKSTSVKGFGV